MEVKHPKRQIKSKCLITNIFLSTPQLPLYAAGVRMGLLKGKRTGCSFLEIPASRKTWAAPIAVLRVCFILVYFSVTNVAWLQLKEEGLLFQSLDYCSIVRRA